MVTPLGNTAYLDGTGFLDTNNNWTLVSAANPLPTTGGGGGGSNASVGITGATAPTSATEIGIIDLSGNLQGVSSTNPLPISGSISATNPSVSATGAAVPASATYMGVKNGANIVGLTEGQATMANSLPVAISSDQSALTVAQATASNLNTTAVLAAGSALAGKFGIDQTTPGTTNAIAISTVGSSAITLGQKVSASSFPVVIASDQSSLSVTSQASQGIRQTASFTAAAQTLTFSVSAYSNVTITLHGAYGAATLHFQVSDDAGATYYDVNGAQNGTQGVVTSTQAFTANTVTAINFPVFGFTNFLITCTAIASGTMVVGATPTGDAENPLSVVSGSVAITGTAQVQGAKSTNAAVPSTTNIGALTAVANAAQPTFTETFLVTPSVNLRGSLRHVIQDAALNDRGVNVTAGNALQADITSVAGTAVVNGGLAGSQSVGGTVATNVAITDNPLNLGAQAVSSENTAVTTARKVQLVSDLVGKLIVLPYANPENFVSGAITSAMTGTTSTSLIAAPATGLRNYITNIVVDNSHATVGTDIIIQDGSGGATLYTIPAAAAFGGASITLPTPLRQPTTATAIFCANVTTGSNTKVSATGYKGA